MGRLMDEGRGGRVAGEGTAAVADMAQFLTFRIADRHGLPLPAAVIEPPTPLQQHRTNKRVGAGHMM